MAEYSDHSSLYENSDYPSRRQAPGTARSSGGSRQAHSGSGASRKHRRRRKKNPVLRGVSIFFKVLGTLLLIGLCTGTLLACFAAVYINEVIVPIADLSPDDFPLGENSIMYYLDKETGQYKEMTTLLSVTKSMWVDYEEMPEHLKQATVAIEDRRFWTHPGVDWRGTAKAVLRMFTGGEISGGSTITQQVIKNMTNYNETTVKRKVTEIVRALRFTQNNSKDDTLEYYLNIIPLGSGCEGVGAGAREYFGKSVSELTLAECASLVGITNNPSKYGPYSFAKSQGVNTDEIWDARRWNKYRQEVILNQMLEQEMISRSTTRPWPRSWSLSGTRGRRLPTRFTPGMRRPSSPTCGTRWPISGTGPTGRSTWPCSGAACVSTPVTTRTSRSWWTRGTPTGRI